MCLISNLAGNLHLCTTRSLSPCYSFGQSESLLLVSPLPCLFSILIAVSRHT